MKKNRENAATTARISRCSIGATLVSNLASGELVVVVMGREYTALRGPWNARRMPFSASCLGFSKARRIDWCNTGVPGDKRMRPLILLAATLVVASCGESNPAETPPE